jgi:hypothetical protein
MKRLQDRVTLGQGHKPRNPSGGITCVLKGFGHMLSMGYPHSKDDGGLLLAILGISLHHYGVARRCIDGARQRLRVKILTQRGDMGQINLCVHPPPFHIGQISLPDEFRDRQTVDHLLKHRAESHIIGPHGGGGDPQQHRRRVRCL